MVGKNNKIEKEIRTELSEFEKYLKMRFKNKNYTVIDARKEIDKKLKYIEENYGKIARKLNYNWEQKIDKYIFWVRWKNDILENWIFKKLENEEIIEDILNIEIVIRKKGKTPFTINKEYYNFIFKNELKEFFKYLFSRELAGRVLKNPEIKNKIGIPAEKIKMILFILFGEDISENLISKNGINIKYFIFGYRKKLIKFRKEKEFKKFIEGR